MWCLRRASGPMVSRSMNSGFASPSIASSTSSTPKRRPTGCPIQGCARPAIPPTVPSSGSISFNNFRRDAARLLAGTAGCTHLTELCALLPTAAIQAFAGDVWNTNDGTPGAAASSGTEQARSKDSTDEHSNNKPPFQLGRCHALRFDGEAVQQFYPRWYGRAPYTADRAASSGDGAARQTGEGGNASGMNDGSGNEVQSNSQTEGNHA